MQCRVFTLTSYSIVSLSNKSSRPGEVNTICLNYLWLENPMESGALQATVRGVQRVRKDIGQGTIINRNSTEFELCRPHKNHQCLLVCGILFSISLSHLALCSKGAHDYGSAVLTTESGFIQWKHKNRRWAHTPGKASGSERIHGQEDGILSVHASFVSACWKC